MFLITEIEDAIPQKVKKFYRLKGKSVFQSWKTTQKIKTFVKYISPTYVKEMSMKEKNDMFCLSIIMPACLFKGMHLAEFLFNPHTTEKVAFERLSKNYPEVKYILSQLIEKGFVLNISTGYLTFSRHNNPFYRKTPETYEPYVILNIYKAQDIDLFDDQETRNAAMKEASQEQILKALLFHENKPELSVSPDLLRRKKWQDFQTKLSFFLHEMF